MKRTLLFMAAFFQGLPLLLRAGPVPDDQLNEWMTPFWKGDVIHNESVLMTAPDGAQPEAPLLFPADEILSVRDSALQTTYAQGADWVYEDGKLKLPPGSRIPFLSESQLHPATAGEPRTTFPRLGGGFLLWNEKGVFHQNQVVVTYRHRPDAWTGPVPAFDPAALPKTLAKLKAKQDLKVVAYGDSITEGYNSSLRLNLPPFQPGWASLVCQWLHHLYGGEVALVNKAVGGKASDWGVATADTAFADQHPDLIVIAFGMNEAGRPVDQFIANTQAIMAAGRRANPDAEFILVAPMLSNREWHPLGNLQAFGPALQALATPGIAFADLTTMHAALLKAKRYADMTGNHVNHPNDFLIRVYAQVVAATLAEP